MSRSRPAESWSAFFSLAGLAISIQGLVQCATNTAPTADEWGPPWVILAFGVLFATKLVKYTDDMKKFL